MYRTVNNSIGVTTYCLPHTRQIYAIYAIDNSLRTVPIYYYT